MAHLVGHVPTMMLATTEPMQEHTSTQVGHTRKTRFSRFCKPVWVTRHSLLASTPTLTGHSPTTLFSGPFKWEAKKTQSWGGNDSTMTLATNEVVQDAWGSLVGHTTIPVRSGSIESVREARLMTVGEDPPNNSDGKSDANFAVMRGATPVSATSDTSTPEREFSGSATSRTATPENATSGCATPRSLTLTSMASGTMTPGREFMSSVTLGTATPATLTPTSDVVPRPFVSPLTVRPDLFDVNNVVGVAHRFRGLGGPSRQACETTANPEEADIPTKGLDHDRIQKLRDKVGIMNIKRLRQD